jgi:hypothetical protein
MARGRDTLPFLGIRKAPPVERGLPLSTIDTSLVHITHAMSTRSRGSLLFFRNLRDQGFGGQHQ